MMPIGETMAVSFQSLRANVLRSILTMLGIVIGVSAVITMVALGTGAQRAVEEQISALGARVLMIFPGQSFHQGVASSQRVSLTTDDYEALKRDAKLLSAVVPEMQQSLQIKYGDKNLNLTVDGTTSDYIRVKSYTVSYGVGFTPGDDEARRRYAVVGADVPDLLETNPAALIHQTLLIRGIPFEVIGVLSRKGAMPGSWSNPDEQILIPLQTAKYRIFGSDRLRTISAEVAAGVPTEQGMVDVERILRREHKIRPGGDNDFMMRNPQEILSTQEQATAIMTTLLAAIAAVSLVVGGIGIMNIMLVSVTERTREIGVRMAIGATRRNILEQFVIEALALCLTGGVVGTLVGWVASTIMARSFHWNTLFSPRAVLVAFGFSAAVGVIFGLWPARRAARLNPIVALRYE